MNDTPGWASPGSAPSDGPDDKRQDGTGQGDDTRDAGPQDAAGQGPQWSKEQPPPAQWSAPSGSGQTPPPPPPAPGQGWGGQSGQGWGGQGGYGQGPGGPGYGGGWGTPPQGGPGNWGPGVWGGPPAAAKPGVIPLRPLGVGEILDGAVSTMRTYWRTVLGISLTVAVVTELLVVLLQGYILNDSSTTAALDNPDATPREILDALGGILVGTGVVLVVTLLGQIIATALLTTVTSRAVLGKPVTTGEAWRDARPQVLRLLGLTLLLPLIVSGIVFVGTIPGILVGVLGSADAGIALAVVGGIAAFVVAIWLMIRLSLASPALMLEKQTIRKAMGRSSKLVRGSWWRVFGIQILAAIITNVVASIVLVPFTLLASAVSGAGVGFFDSTGDNVGWAYLIITGIGSVIGSTLTFPISAGVTVLLYIDQRIRREALDLELARAAGLQGYGDTPGATPGS
ncbi:glycerophosphoryl diester phosphodiesterase membrane domain-containing protein [Streptomyces sp. VRA16 Mangrove soil]|uniref:glycerophosphoryl diester phosphodiesterase membrane domain-containing protein n=1 Tax=Streptomyces sp. VRA16 Mangrove soil TaxID=2817434 RepID=UPI001A9E5F10|nr:glycerophosphoryl diester phosphodiesterase membrane domain-containing protein [Streptomyces sp. VRA16 Mangrove soil]MBO1338021.1 glycerophosphoryl diester phosphodiesterase membrane domain-containing protein [Streptomyces sp. VRA16 Mangrove soil]